MSETIKDWVLPNGYTFIASTAGWYGSWAKATDPLTAARKAARGEHQFVSVWYGPSATTYINDMGGLQYLTDNADKIVPIGFFEVKKNSIKPSQDDRYTHSEFMTHELRRFVTAYENRNK